MSEDKAPKEEVRAKAMLEDLVEIKKLARQIAKKDFFFTMMSAKVDELVKALCEWKKDLPEMLTDKMAAGRYKYQTLSALLNAITPGLAEQGVEVMQPVHSISEQTYVVTFVFHSSGQFMRSVTTLPEQYIMAGKLVTTKENLQAMGGAITYTKRHALKSMLGIDADEDTDGNSPYTSNGNSRYSSQ